jgi:hypothetical protein
MWKVVWNKVAVSDTLDFLLENVEYNLCNVKSLSEMRQLSDALVFLLANVEYNLGKDVKGCLK